MDVLMQTGDRKVIKVQTKPKSTGQMGLGTPSVYILLGQKNTWRHQGCQLHLQIIHYFCVVPLNTPSVMATPVK